MSVELPGVSITAQQATAFVLAAWAVIGNDALQTLGPFLQANRGRIAPIWQGLYLAIALCIVLVLGWLIHGGDGSWGRLQGYPPSTDLAWSALLAPLAVLLLTRLGAPVSTSFLLLLSFRPANLPVLLRQSLLGYGVALVTAIAVYGWPMAWAGLQRREIEPDQTDSAETGSSWVLAAASRFPGRRRVCPSPGSALSVFSGACVDSGHGAPSGEGARSGGAWTDAEPWALVLQWIVTGWLWSQWLIQDLANLYVYLPRHLGPGQLMLSLLVLCAGIGLLLVERGGAIQGILLRKRDLDDPRATTALSLLYGLVLSGFAAFSRQPMSTTWVFLGLLAGRELALLRLPDRRPLRQVAIDLARDVLLAGLGLGVSLLVAVFVRLLQPLP